MTIDITHFHTPLDVEFSCTLDHHKICPPSASRSSRPVAHEWGGMDALTAAAAVTAMDIDDNAGEDSQLGSTSATVDVIEDI